MDDEKTGITSDQASDIERAVWTASVVRRLREEWTSGRIFTRDVFDRAEAGALEILRLVRVCEDLGQVIVNVRHNIRNADRGEREAYKAAAEHYDNVRRLRRALKEVAAIASTNRARWTPELAERVRLLVNETVPGRRKAERIGQEEATA